MFSSAFLICCPAAGFLQQLLAAAAAPSVKFEEPHHQVNASVTIMAAFNVNVEVNASQEWNQITDVPRPDAVRLSAKGMKFSLFNRKRSLGMVTLLLSGLLLSARHFWPFSATT